MSYTSQQVLKYIKKIHKKGFSLDHTVQNHAEWELDNIPVADLQIASDNDPYNRILDLDQDHVDSITKQDILAHAIVVDENGHIIDGNHRAAKAQALGMTHVPAFVPVVDPDNETYDQFMKRTQANEVTIDNKQGAGAVPYNQDVDYFGLRVKMKPSVFLRLAAPLGREHSAELEQYIKDGGAIGAPFLDLAIPKEWDDGDFSMPAKVQGHEGRNRMTAIQKIEGDAPIEVHLFPKGGYRARDLTPDYINGFNKGLFAEKSTSIVRGPLFDYNVSESMFTPYELAIMEGGHAIEESADPKAWIEKMYSKYQAWPMDSNQRVMVWGEGEEQQFAVFELKPSMSKRGAVEVAWFQAYPLRQGVGSRAMKELQAQAQADGISLTLYPWDKGRVSQAKLIKFYKQAGFKPATKGAKNMAWSPEGTVSEAFDLPYRLKWEKSDYGDVDAIAKMDDGNYLSIMFNKGVNQDNEEAWSVEFFRNNSQEVTGEGDAQRVFATVLSAIQTFIKKYKPNKVIFSASKEVEQGQNAQSRAKLYDSLVQRYARLWGFRALRADTSNKVIYELTRIKPIVAKPVPEARVNPDQNTKYESGMKELVAVAKTIADPENWAISMTSEAKLGINPQVGISEDTPKGIYFYPLDYAVDLARRGKKLPWGSDYPYIQLFQYDRSGEMTKETSVDENKLKQALKQYCSEDVIQQAIDEPEYDGTPYYFIYDCLSRLGKSDETNVVRWNKVLRDLGFTSVFDPGHGWIAYNEPTQGVVLDPRIIKQLKTIVNKKKSRVVTPAMIEQAIFDTLDMELAANRAWQAYDPDGSKLRQAAKEYAKDPKFKPWFGKPGTEEIYDNASAMGRYGARQLSQEAWEWYKAQQAPKTESINEGGWASTATQNTVITPRTVVEIMEALKTFESSFNTWQAKQELDVEIKIGGPKGSGTYYRRDLEQDPEREYGDVDVECFIHSRAGVSSAQRITEYRMAITDYCLQSPDYSTENGTNIIMKTSSGAVQVDMLYTFHEHANWSRALSPEYRVKGVISTSLTSSLAEVLNLSFSSQGIQVKIRNNQPVSFRQSKDVELRTVSTTPETWAQDIYSLYYYLANGEKPSEFPGGLKAHGGLKDEQRLSDIVLSIKSLANAMEESGLLGHGSLISIHDKKDMIRKVAGVYSKKLETAENSSKFDKAQTPAAVEKAKKTKLMLAKYRNEITKLLLN